jgi:hypothetical protein
MMTQCTVSSPALMCLFERTITSRYDLSGLLLFYISLSSFYFFKSDSYFLRIVPLRILDYFLMYLFNTSLFIIKHKRSLFS